MCWVSSAVFTITDLDHWCRSMHHYRLQTLWLIREKHYCIHGLFTRYVKLQVAHAPGMPGTFSPPPIQRKLLVSDPGMHQGTCVTHVPWCMWGIADLGWRGKRSRHSRRMRSLQCCVSGKRHIAKAGTIVLCCTTFHWQSSRQAMSIYLCGWFLHTPALYFVVYFMNHPERPRHSLKPVSQAASMTIYVAVSL